MGKKKGFTLIELLVVIAIIALLLAILMPALAKVKKVAQDVVCRSNLKQWSLIWAIYTQENNGKFPFVASGPQPRGQWINPMRKEWETELGILRCPSAAKYINFDDPYPHGSYTSTYEMENANTGGLIEKCSYGLNVWAYSQGPIDPTDTSTPPPNGFPFKAPASNFWRSIDVRNSSNIPLFMDSMWRGALPNYYDSGVGNMAMPDVENETNDWKNGGKGVAGGIRHVAMPRHGSGSKAGTNVLFMDLSAKHVNIKEMWTLKWHKNFNTGGYLTEAVWPAWMDKYTEP